MTGTSNTNRRSCPRPTSAALLFPGQVLLREERTMADKLPKDSLRLIQYICRDGVGSVHRDGGEAVVEYPGLWKVRMKVKNRRKDSCMELYNLAKAVRDLRESEETG